jgi:hypothetical protein
VQAHAVAGELRAVIEGVALAQVDEDWRHQKHMRDFERDDPLAWGVGKNCSDLLRPWPAFVKVPPRLLGRRALRALRHAAGGAVSEPPVPEPEKYEWRKPRDREVDALALLTCAALVDYDAAVDLIESLDDAQRVSMIWVPALSAQRLACVARLFSC